MNTPQSSTQNSTLAVVTAIYMVILGIGSFCLNIALVASGSLLGGLAEEIESMAETNAEAAAMASEAAAVGGFASILGIIGLVLAIAAFVVGVGLFMRKPWAYMGAIYVCAALILIWLLGVLFGGGINIIQIIFLIINAIIIFLFRSDKATKEAFGRA